jgi:hypothetical protein
MEVWLRGRPEGIGQTEVPVGITPIARLRISHQPLSQPRSRA